MKNSWMQTGLGVGFALLLASAAGAGKIEGEGGRSAPTVPPECRDIDLNGPGFFGNALELIGGRCGTLARALTSVALGSGVKLRDGTLLTDISLEGTSFRSPGAGVLDLSGALMLGKANDGGAVQVRVDAVVASGDARLYQLSYQWGDGTDLRHFRPAAGPWRPLCPAGERALPLAGEFSTRKGRVNAEPTTVTWACEGAALAKCALRLGYKPWQRHQSARGAMSLAPYHEACVRALRADYCGDGTSFTVKGTPINLYDRLEIQRDEAEWPVEAEWSDHGALCLSRERHQQLPGAARPVRAEIKARCPGLKPCAAAMSAEALLRTEVQP